MTKTPQTPMEQAGRAIAEIACDGGVFFNTCAERAKFRGTFCSCRKEAQAAITAYLQASLNDPATVERCSLALDAAEGESLHHKTRAIIKALADE